jgi:signal peptide peptidase SppA
MFDHLKAWILSQPWAIDQAKASEILAYLELREQSTREEIEAQRIHPSRERAVRDRDGAIGIVTIHGIMAQRRVPGASTGGGVSTTDVGKRIDQLAADNGTKAIIIDIDSPGGSVAGTRELGDKVRRAALAKPVIAQVDSLAASAAYWVASQATEIVSTPGGQAGSIGVLMMHENIAGAMEAHGVKVTMISAGRYKTEGHPYAELDEDAVAHYQSQVDTIYHDFVTDVSTGRDLSHEKVEKTFGQGRLLLAKEALGVGMVDRIATFDETLARFSARQQLNRRARAARAQKRM